MRSQAEIADAFELLDGVLRGELDLGDVPEDTGLQLAATADALSWMLEHDEALLGKNLTNLRLALFAQHRHAEEYD